MRSDTPARRAAKLFWIMPALILAGVAIWFSILLSPVSYIVTGDMSTWLEWTFSKIDQAFGQ